MEFITLFGTPKREPTVFEKIKDAVKQTKANFTEQIQDLVQGKKEIDAEMLEDLETIMISADIGVTTTNEILKSIKDQMSRKTLQDPSELRSAIKEELRKILNVNYTPPKEVPERSEEHTSELQSRVDLVCRLLLEKKNKEIARR